MAKSDDISKEIRRLEKEKDQQEIREAVEIQKRIPLEFSKLSEPPMTGSGRLRTR